MKKITVIKKTGATFTPIPLADYLSNKLMRYCDNLSNKIVVDPACGDGSLLVSNFPSINILFFFFLYKDFYLAC